MRFNQKGSCTRGVLTCCLNNKTSAELCVTLSLIYSPNFHLLPNRFIKVIHDSRWYWCYAVFDSVYELAHYLALLNIFSPSLDSGALPLALILADCTLADTELLLLAGWKRSVRSRQWLQAPDPFCNAIFDSANYFLFCYGGCQCCRRPEHHITFCLMLE